MCWLSVIDYVLLMSFGEAFTLSLWSDRRVVICRLTWIAMRPRKYARLAGTRSGTRGNDQGQTPLPVPENWQQLMAEMQARLQSQDELIRILQQQAPSGSAAPSLPPAVVPAVQLGEVVNRWEPLYERFRKQQPPVFEGGSDPLKAE